MKKKIIILHVVIRQYEIFQKKLYLNIKIHIFLYFKQFYSLIRRYQLKISISSSISETLYRIPETPEVQKKTTRMPKVLR